MEYKQALVVRMDLKLPKGKMAAQAAHASSEAVLRSDKEKVKKWRNQGQMKVVLKASGLKELRQLNKDAKELGLVTALITDAGKTVIMPGTVTCLGIGPDEAEKVDKVLGHLKLV
ncbi:peptidyl-tRNA hydrolase Pth2 [Nanoarchaeota archaeon]